ncbi:MAG: hypothetical protein COC15_00340 [Legionellales bacterium]|nr:MAG: hypothetical protein COC15_00340 [Legionellales bacterium]
MQLYKALNIGIILAMTNATNALTFAIGANDTIVGRLTHATIQRGESLADIGRQFNLGIFEMIEANTKMHYLRPKAGATVVIPSQFIIPDGKREGIIVNLPEMRLYYFHPNKRAVSTFPIGIGRTNWTTPLGATRITEKKKNPDWTPPKSIRKVYEAKGKFLPAVVPAGPNNPLGDYALRLGIPGYLIHGTNMPKSVGMRSSSGCIRMFPEDIAALFNMVRVGTKVQIIHDAYKIGSLNDTLYLEAHDPLPEEIYGSENLEDELANHNTSVVNWRRAEHAVEITSGYPVVISD